MSSAAPDYRRRPRRWERGVAAAVRVGEARGMIDPELDAAKVEQARRVAAHIDDLDELARSDPRLRLGSSDDPSAGPNLAQVSELSSKRMTAERTLSMILGDLGLDPIRRAQIAPAAPDSPLTRLHALRAVPPAGS